MIPILFGPEERDFTANGLGRLAEATRCVVHEERNGQYELELDYPITGRHYEEMEEGAFIVAIHDDRKDPQPFFIYRNSMPDISGTVTFYCRHISYLLSNIILNPYTASSCAQALAQMPAMSANDNPFTFWTDKSVTGTFRVTTPVSVRNALGGMAGSILDVYGKGEYEWDGYNVKLYLNRGSDNGVSIRYGKNLADISRETSYENTYNAVAPFWASEDETVTLPELLVVAESIPVRTTQLESHTNEEIVDHSSQEIDVTYYSIKAIPLDLSQDFEEKPTVEQLREKAASKLASGDSLQPADNITVNFEQLWQTEDYKDVAVLQRVSLCDTVHIYYEQAGINASAKCIAVDYDVLNERYTSMELGAPKTTLAEQITTMVESKVYKEVPTHSMLQNAINAATALITGGYGGFVKWIYLDDGTPSELLFMDSPEEGSAVNILRINKNGIGFSNDGGNTYRTAWTLDGHFVADYIDTGTLNANLLKAGIIMDAKGKNYWNLQTGEISISYDPGEEGEVTRADLARVEQNAQNWANDAEQNAKDYTDTTLTGYATEEYVTGSISIAKEGIETEFSDTFATKADAVTQQVQYYYQSTSPTQLFGGQWSTTAPTYRDGMYIWTKQRYYKGTGTYTESDPVCITGNTGEDGRTGDDALYLYITSNASTMTAKETPQNVTLTGCVGKGDSVDIDPNGTIYRYAWYMQKDSEKEAFYDSGKRIPLTINGNLFEDRAQMRFTLVDADFFELVTHDGTAITNASGTAIEVG